MLIPWFFLAILSGYPTFVVSILMVGGNTALIGDIAGHLGCFIFLKDCVNAIAFVALGTSVPGETCARGIHYQKWYLKEINFTIRIGRHSNCSQWIGF